LHTPEWRKAYLTIRIQKRKERYRGPLSSNVPVPQGVTTWTKTSTREDGVAAFMEYTKRSAKEGGREIEKRVIPTMVLSTWGEMLLRAEGKKGQKKEGEKTIALPATESM